MSDELKAKLLSRIEIVEGPLSTPCWEWMGARTRDRGEISWKGKTLRTHRVSWEVHCGPIPEGMLIAHRCDNPPCCNPFHLWLATPEENIQDCIAKGRRASSDKFGRRTLTEEKVAHIKYFLLRGNYTQQAIGDMFGVTQMTISAIKQGRTWPGVEPSLNPVMPPSRQPTIKHRKLIAA